MKCPKCQAKLLPVDGEMFCLQCGTAVMPKKGIDMSEPDLEETTDPLLQKAIEDSLGHEVKFKLPVSGAPPVTATKAFVSMRQALAPPKMVPAGAVAAGPALSAVGGPTGATHSANGGDKLDVGSAVETLAAGLARGIVAWRQLPKAWLAGLAAFGLFLVLNGAIYAGFNNRVYPGVKVGDADLSGLSFAQLHSKLAAMAKPASLTVRVGESSYPLAVSNAVDPSRLETVEMQARDAGHSTPLPLAGLLESVVSKPLQLQAGLSDAAARAAAAELAKEVSYAPTPATVMVVSGKVLLIADKPGQTLDVARSATAIQAAYGKGSAVNLQAQKLQAVVTAGDFAAETERAQAMLAQTVKVHVKSAVYEVSASQMGDWLVVVGPGKGVSVNGAGVANYVAGLPGKFDRTGTVNAIIAAINSGQSLDYKASTSRVTAVPKLASTAAPWPLVSYSYCLGSGVDSDAGGKVATVLSDKAGWALGGRIRLMKSENGCNFSINIVPDQSMASLDPGCKAQTSCLAGNSIAITESAWKAVPSKWSGTLDTYRSELVNHEVGHWLGFEHAPCLAQSTKATTPILASPDVVLSGCSPNWYAVPVNQRGTKVLPGFN